MKLSYKIIFFVLAVAFTGCKEDLAELNIDPNKSPTARPQELLTSGLGYLGWIVDGRYNNHSQLWGQYWTWGPGVSLGNAARYVAEPDDHNNLWARSYSNALADLAVIQDNGDAAFAGMSRVVSAYIYQGLVDHFDAVPFSEALKGEIEKGGILAPGYDGGAAVYTGIISLLDEGLANLEAAERDGLVVGGEDLLFHGDLNAWMEFARSLKLRVLLRQSANTDVTAQVRDLLASGTMMTGYNAEIAFSGASGSENPMYAVKESGIGNFYVASNTTLDVLRSLDDPRIAAFYDVAPNVGDYVGVSHGAIDEECDFTCVIEDLSQGSAITYGNANSVILMSNWEVNFLLAEAALRFGGDDAAAFNAAIAASFDYLGVSGAAAYAASLDYAGGDQKAKLRNIGTQKWISMNGLQEDEGWIEARRFDTPDDPFFTNATDGIYKRPAVSALGEGQHPSIWLYPESEVSLNPNAPAQHNLNLLGKVFWDR